MSKKHARLRARKRVQFAASPKRENVVRMYAVYAYDLEDDDLAEGKILCFVDQQTRDTWVEQGAAVPWNRGRGIKLRNNLPARPQCSLTMAAGISEGYAAGKEYARACVNAYRPRSGARVVELAA